MLIRHLKTDKLIPIVVFLFGCLVAIAGIVPLYNGLRDMEDRELLERLHLQNVITSQYISRLKDIGVQITSRTRIRDYLDAYNRGEINKETLIKFTYPKLLDAMRHTPEIKGIMRLDRNGLPVVTVGKNIPETYINMIHDEREMIRILDFLNIDNTPHLLMSTNITDRGERKIGADLILFDASRLINILEQAKEEINIESIIIWQLIDGKKIIAISTKSASENKEMISDIPGAGLVHKGGSILASSLIEDDNFGITIRIKEAILYKKIRHTVFITSLISLLIIISGTIAIALVSYRLRRKIEKEVEQRKEVERSLRMSEARLRSIIDNTTAVIYVKDINGRYLLINRQFEKIFHVNSKEIAGKTDHDIFPSSFADEFRLHDRKVIRERRAIEFDEILPHSDGSHYYISIKFPLFDEGGMIYAVCSISTDITERKLAEDRLRESERMYRELIDNMHEFVAEIGLDGKFKFVNRTFIENTGYTEEELIGSDFFSYIHLDDRVSVTEHCMRLQNDGIPIRGCEYRFRVKDGSYLYFITNGDPITDRDSKIIAILQISFDMTERKKTELELQRQIDNLKGMNEILQDITSTLHLDKVLEKIAMYAANLTRADASSIAMYDSENDLIRYPYHYKMPEHLKKIIASKGKGLARYVIQRRAPLTLNDYPSHPMALQEFIDAGVKTLLAVPLIAREKVLGALGVFGFSWDKEFTQRDLEVLEAIGKEASIAIENARMFEEIKEFSKGLEEKVKARTSELLGTQKSLIKIIKDLDRTKQELEVANERLKELDRLKSMFIASMSHELRTPLNSIIGFTGIILQGLEGEINDEQRDSLQRVYTSAKHLLSLITDIIDISKIEAGRLEININEFYLKDVIMEAVSTMEHEIRDKDLDLEIDIDESIYMHTDRKRLFQCILNYLSNAVKFTEQGKITIFAHIEGDIVEISVSDTGPGISPEDMNLLFKSFTRLGDAVMKSKPGTGLGLYLTKRLAEDILHGSVGVESELGRGSRFILRIPVRIDHPPYEMKGRTYYEEGACNRRQ